MVPELSRRSFLGAAAAVPLSLWLEQDALAGPAEPMVRYDARCADGQAMLKSYARAVQKMKSTAEGDPRGWLFQWYTHWVAPLDPSLNPYDPRQKAEEIARIYPAATAWRDLAEAMWDTCQAHGDDTDENFFLPWHRLFVHHFERIVRRVSGNSSFTLPYWDYSAADTAIRGVIPPEFRRKDDPLFGSLYVENRNPGVNDGQSIHQGRPGDPLSLASLAQCLYEPQGAENGFCKALDWGLHGSVHVLVGDRMNMGFVPWAARDPIFWLHHCNLDRLWASWNAAGRANPSLSQTFAFVDGDGQRVDRDVSDVLDLGNLGYAYDRLEPVPACSTARRAMMAAASAQRPVAANRGREVELGAGPIRVTLDPAPPAEGQAVLPFASRVQALPAGHRLLLTVSGLRTEQQPGVLYDLYLELPVDAKQEQRKDYYVGSLNFFHASAHGAHAAGAPPGRGPTKLLSFDITDLARKLHGRRLLVDKATLTIVPGGQPAADAKPVIGEIRIVEQ